MGRGSAAPSRACGGNIAPLELWRGTADRLVKLSGNGALVKSASTVDAVTAMIEIQQAMADANKDQPQNTASSSGLVSTLVPNCGCR